MGNPEDFTACDIDAAIAAHEALCLHFEVGIVGMDARRLNNPVLFDPARCALGAWLHAPAQQHFAHLPAFRGILDAHEKVHLTAARIVSLLRADRIDDALLLLEADFAETSRALSMMLAEFLKRD